LSSEVLTGMDAVFDASTTRLAAHVGYLEAKHGWRIVRGSKVVGCRDGRVATIATYSLPDATIAMVMSAGGAEWCAAVRLARRALRTRDAHARALAAKANIVAAKRRRAAHSSGQFDLFGQAGSAP
jgi:hypothetical protein